MQEECDRASASGVGAVALWRIDELHASMPFPPTVNASLTAPFTDPSYAARASAGEAPAAPPRNKRL